MLPPYSRENFVGRIIELADVRNNWIDDTRWEVLVILGPPRAGKSWFVSMLNDILRELEDYNPTPPVFPVAISQLVVEDPPQIGRCTVSEHKYTDWVQRFIALYQPHIATIPAYDPNKELLASVEALADALAQQFGDKPVYLLIDDGDLLAKEFWRDFEKKIIEVFHTVEESHFRFVVALRDDEVSLPGLKRKLLYIDPWPGDEGDEQLERLLAGENHHGWTVNRLKKKLPGYDWRHPGLNGYLYNTFVVEGTQRVSRRTLLDEGLGKVLHATSADHSVQEIVDWLKGLIVSDRDWNEADLEELWWDEARKNQAAEADLDVVHRREYLLSHWLFVAAGTNGDRWRLPPGVASYVRACL